MWVNFSINTTDVSNAGVTLRIAIPGGFTCAKTVQQLIRIVDAGTSAVGLAIASTSSTFIECFATVGAGGFSITAADNTYVIGQVAFEVL
jgi:hypothetical protein